MYPACLNKAKVNDRFLITGDYYGKPYIQGERTTRISSSIVLTGVESGTELSTDEIVGCTLGVQEPRDLDLQKTTNVLSAMNNHASATAVLKKRDNQGALKRLVSTNKTGSKRKANSDDSSSDSDSNDGGGNEDGGAGDRPDDVSRTDWKKMMSDNKKMLGDHKKDDPKNKKQKNHQDGSDKVDKNDMVV